MYVVHVGKREALAVHDRGASRLSVGTVGAQVELGCQVIALSPSGTHTAQPCTL